MMRRLPIATALCLAIRATALAAQPIDDAPKTEQPKASVVESKASPHSDLTKLNGQPKAELLVNVELSGNQKVARYEVRSTVSDAVLLVCHETCAFKIWPGRYRLLTFSNDGRHLGERAILLEQDSKVAVQTVPLIEPVLGTVLTVVGTVAVVVGGYLFSQTKCNDGCDTATARTNKKGAFIFLSGAVAIPLGVLLLSNGLEPDVTVTPSRLSSSDRAALLTNHSRQQLSWSFAF
jgi:hypothetical protein